MPIYVLQTYLLTYCILGGIYNIMVAFLKSLFPKSGRLCVCFLVEDAMHEAHLVRQSDHSVHVLQIGAFLLKIISCF